MPRAEEWGLAIPIEEPKQWYPADGGKRREPVLDHNDSPPRVVRYVGYRNCLRCGVQFFSQDVRGQRMCKLCRENQGGFPDW